MKSKKITYPKKEVVVHDWHIEEEKLICTYGRKGGGKQYDVVFEADNLREHIIYYNLYPYCSDRDAFIYPQGASSVGELSFRELYEEGHIETQWVRDCICEAELEYAKLDFAQFSCLNHTDKQAYLDIYEEGGMNIEMDYLEEMIKVRDRKGEFWFMNQSNYLFIQKLATEGRRTKQAA